MPEMIYQRQLQISVEKATWPRLKFLKSTRVKRTLTQLKAIPRMSMWSLQSMIQVPTKKLGGYPYEMIQTTLSDVSFAGRQSALQQKAKARKQILLFVTTYHSSVSNLKNILIQNWDLIQNQPLLNTIFKNPPPILSYRRGKFLTDMLVKAKLWRRHSFTVKSRRKVREDLSLISIHLQLYHAGSPWRPVTNFYQKWNIYVQIKD